MCPSEYMEANTSCSTANSADGGFFKMKGEKMWDDTEISILTSHGLGALNVADLVAAFNTIPLHEKLNIPEEALPVRTLLVFFCFILCFRVCDVMSEVTKLTFVCELLTVVWK